MRNATLSDRQRRARRSTRLLVGGAAALFLAIVAFTAWADRERPRPALLHEVTLEVAGLH